MTLKDRTNEFNMLAEGIKAKKVPTVSKRIKKTQEKSNFSNIAAQIGLGIAATTEKLDRLTKLAKRKSLFDDPSVEIQELTTVINQDIKNINNQIAVLQQFKDSANRNKQSETHTDTVVNTLKNKLQKTTKGFTQVLEIRTENLKVQQREKENFTGSSLSPFSKRTMESPLYKPASAPESSPASDEVAIAMPQQALLITQDRYLSTRADAVQSIERTITELQLIFRQLATLVAEQGEQIERIDRDIDLTDKNVTNAHNQLLRYLTNISSNRWLMIKVFFVLIFFALVFIVFFV
jgi:syntaxin 5